MRLMKLLERRKIHEKRQREVRLMRAGIQLAFFIAAPSLFSTAFAGIKSIFLAIGSGQAVEWNSFLTVTAVLLIFTCFSEDISVDMRVRSDPSAMPCTKAFPGSGRNVFIKKETSPF